MDGCLDGYAIAPKKLGEVGVMSEVIQATMDEIDNWCQEWVRDNVSAWLDELERLKEEVEGLKEKITIKDDVICASKLVIEEYKKGMSIVSKRIYAVVYKNGQVDAWSTDQGPPSMPYVHEWEVQSEIDMLKKEIEELKELVRMILAEAYRNGVEIIVHEKNEVHGEA